MTVQHVPSRENTLEYGHVSETAHRQPLGKLEMLTKKSFIFSL